MARNYSFSKICTIILSVLIGCTVLVGCGNNSETSITKKSSSSDLAPYLGMEINDARSKLGLSGLSTSGDTDGHDLLINNDSSGNFSAIMSAQGGEYINSIQIYNNKNSLSIMGIYVGMPSNEALDILSKNKFTFSEIYDGSDTEKGDYQYAFYKLNGVYQIGFSIYGGKANPYGSLSESDVWTDGTVGEVSILYTVANGYGELANYVGDRSGYGTTLVDSINDECAELTKFVENESFDVEGVHEYGTYVFGDEVMSIDLQPGKGAYPYATRIAIMGVCPYELCGIHYNMDKESALTHMADLGITEYFEDGNSITFEIDSYTTLELQFTNDCVSFIECVDDYPEEHEKRFIEE